MSSAVENDEVVRLARAAITDLVPVEVEIFDPVAEEWIRRGRRKRRARSAVGFGLDEVLHSELFLAVIAAALQQVLTGGTVRRICGRVLGRRAADRSLRVDADRLRAAVRKHAMALGLEPMLVDPLCDAVVGAYVAPESSG